MIFIAPPGMCQLNSLLEGQPRDGLASERRGIKVAPHGANRFVAAAVDEIAEHPCALAEEDVVAVPFIDAEIGVDAVGDRVPRHRPAHPLFQPCDIRLRGVDECRVGRVQMSEVGDLIGAEEQPRQAWSGQPNTPGSKKAR